MANLPSKQTVTGNEKIKKLRKSKVNMRNLRALPKFKSAIKIALCERISFPNLKFKL